jgi:signal transduction histidine kinase
MRKLFEPPASHHSKTTLRSSSGKRSWIDVLFNRHKNNNAYHISSVFYNTKSLSDDATSIMNIGKRQLSLGIFLFIFLFFYIVVFIVQKYTDNEPSKIDTVYSTINHDFFTIDKQFKKIADTFNEDDKNPDATSLSKKTSFAIQTLMGKYPFFDVFYLVDVFQIDLNDAPKVTLYDFRINPLKNTDKLDDTYTHTVSKEINQIIKEHPNIKGGFLYFKTLKEKSAYYVMPIIENKFVFIRINQQDFSNHYTTDEFIPYFKNTPLETQNTSVKKISFNYIKNISHLILNKKEHSFSYFDFFVLCLDFGLLGILSFASIIGYRALCHYNIGLHKIKLLDNELKRVYKNKNSHDMRMQYLVESTNLVPWTADPQENIFTYVGSQITSITGGSYENWTTPGFWLSHVHKDDRDIFFKALNKVKNEMYVTIEYRIYNDYGDIIWLRNTLSKISYHDTDIEAEKTMLQGFMTDITSDKKVFENIEKARLAAEKASNMKSNFLASMSHELRTPLNSIIGFADIIRSIPHNNENIYVKEYSENILLSGKHLLDLINDILDYSKIEAGEFQINIEPTLIADIFKSCQTLIQNRADNAKIALLIQPIDNSIYINADHVRIKQVLINLLTNAIKFNRPNGKVALSYEISADGNLILKVTDTGIGMKPDDLKIALEKFRQVDSDKNRHQEGTGLGLSISKSLVELHGGTLSLTSIYGKGTQVVLTFPPEIIYTHTHNTSSL